MQESKIIISNAKKIEDWLYYHCVQLNHRCDGIKKRVGGDLVNASYRDTITGEMIYLEYETKLVE